MFAKGTEKYVVIKLSLLAGKNIGALKGTKKYVGKKKLGLLAGEILPCATDLSHQRSKHMFDFLIDSVQNRIIFFLFGNPT